MPNFQRLFCPRQAKPGRSGKADYSREIALALFIKFCLLGILWWSFFAGQKIPVDAGSVARVLLNAPVKY
ncbi:MAG: hypothetical protein LUQ57_06720 [Methylococcaceae bacterium]|nr:hypothetical protein [Methylococcaceae bacterium]